MCSPKITFTGTVPFARAIRIGLSNWTEHVPTHTHTKKKDRGNCVSFSVATPSVK